MGLGVSVTVVWEEAARTGRDVGARGETPAQAGGGQQEGRCCQGEDGWMGRAHGCPGSFQPHAGGRSGSRCPSK